MLGVALMLLFGASQAAHALAIDLDLYVSIGLADETLSQFLTDGMTVQIIISDDATQGASGAGTADDQFSSHGSGNYLASTTQGDDFILATTTIGTGVAGGDGDFYYVISGFDPAVYSLTDPYYIYIRFFNAPPGGLEGDLYWGLSTMIEVDSSQNNEIDLNPDGDLATDKQNNFVVIPEPSSVSFFAMVGGVMWAMRARMRKKIAAGRAGTPEAVAVS